MNTQPENGALFDTRTEEEKKGDINFKEIVAAASPVIWTEKISTSWRKFPIFNQDGSGSCVAQTMAKIMGVLYYLKNSTYVHFSASHIYQRRSNKPSQGMNGNEVFKIAKEGVTLEVLAPSQDLSDIQMDSQKIEEYKQDVGKIFRAGEPVFGPIRDIETIASIIQETGKAVMVWYYFTRDEWTDVPTILTPLTLSSPNAIRHSVTAVDFTLYQGKKCLIIEDSWGPNFGRGGQRIITEEFHNTRNWFVAHVMNFKFDDMLPLPQKPHHTFLDDLQLGETNNEVKILQECLKYEHLFPWNIESTGYFGAVTKKAVQDFQKKYKISPVSGIVGPLTRAHLNLIFSQ